MGIARTLMGGGCASVRVRIKPARSKGCKHRTPNTSHMPTTGGGLEWHCKGRIFAVAENILDSRPNSWLMWHVYDAVT